MSSAKYAPAPTQDPDDVPTHVTGGAATYTQAPPDYHVPSSSAQDEQRLFDGAPRNSEDDVPDDFKVGLLPF